MKPRKLFLKVHTRKGIILDEEVKSISSVNDKGKFDVLQQHAQFISKIKDHIRFVKLNGEDLIIPVGDAIMRVKGVEVEVFLGIKAN